MVVEVEVLGIAGGSRRLQWLAGKVARGCYKSSKHSCAAGEGKQRRLVEEKALSENSRVLLALLRQYMALYTLQGFNWLKNQVIW